MAKELSATGSCWCGCKAKTDSFFSAGHDKKAESMLMKLIYGPVNPVAAFLADHGYGAEKNLLEAFEGLEKSSLKAWTKKGLRPAASFNELSRADEEEVNDVLSGMDEWFQSGKFDYEVNTNEPDNQKISSRVWKEVVRRAEELGYEGEVQGAIVTVRRR